MSTVIRAFLFGVILFYVAMLHVRHQNVMALLLAKGATPSDANSYGSTCLHLAARAPQNAAACVALLLAHSGGGAAAAASVQAPNHRGSSPLHFAVFAVPDAEAVGAVCALTAAGADPNAADLEGCSPLFAAANLKSLAVVHALLTAGADPTRADVNGRTPVKRVCARQFRVLVGQCSKTIVGRVALM
jgi:cytohesin